jgi:hypothetical protein
MSAEARVRILICDSNSDCMDLKRKTKKVVTNALVLQADDKFEYAEAGRIQNLVKNYSQFISFPIYTWQEKSRTKEVEEEADEVKEGAEEDNKEACIVFCYFLLCQLDLFVLFFSYIWVLCCITQLICRCLCYTFSAV